jgi:hypothetical protein
MRLLFLLLVTSFAYGQKDTAYWNHIYHPQRLIFEKANVIFKGTVVKVLSEADGDYHVLVQNDSTSLNVEIICAFPQNNKICSCYTNNITKPKKGMKIEVVGDYVFDNKHKWYEIHPVKQIKIIP